MAAPSAGTRSTPAGIRLRDGFATKICFTADTDVSLWEISVSPPGADGGDAVDTTTMWNTTYRTKYPRTLKEITDSSFTAAYDPTVLTQIIALVNVATTVTVIFPDGSTWAFFGYLRSFEPDEITEGEMPTATVNIVATNTDTSFAEQAPAVSSVAGT